MSNWKSIVATVAPGIATALGGPLAGIAVKTLSGALLGKDDGTQAEVEEAILQADPEALARVREADADLKARLAQAGVDLEKMAAQDRASARSMAMTKGLTPQVILAAIFVCGFVAVLYSVFSGMAPLTDTTRDVVIYLLGILSAGLTQVMNFFFGSSAGSKEKTAALGTLAR